MSTAAALPQSSSTDMKILRETFALFDKNGSQRISVRDMGDFLRLMGEEVNEDDITEMLREVSGTSKPSLDFDTFVKFMMSEEEREQQEKKAENVATPSSKRSSASSTSSSSSRPGTASGTKKSSTSTPLKKKLIPKLKIGSTNQSVSQRKRSKSNTPQQQSTSSKIFNFLSPRTASRQSKRGDEKTSSHSARSSSRSSKRTSTASDSSTPKNRKRANSSNSANDTETLCGDRTLQDMKRAFQAFDLDNDGKLSTREVGIMMRRFGLGSAEKSIQNLFDLLDDGAAKQSGAIQEIDFDQFLKLTTLV